MDISGAGTAVMLAIAAGLWFLYLVPTWFRQREYLATERTATRLQQTIRVMAETAEMPDTVRVAATARDAARQERILRAQLRREDRRADAAAAREATAVPAPVRRSTGALSAAPSASPSAAPSAARSAAPSAAPSAVNRDPTGATQRARMRRTRRMASLLMVAATIVGLLQIWAMTTGGAVVGSWVVLAGAFVAGALAIATQSRLDARAMPRAARATAPSRARPASAERRVPSLPAAPAPWTPVPVPQPLYLSKPAPQPVVPAATPDTLRRQAEEAARPAQPPAEVVPLAPVARPAASRFAGMGIVDPAASAAPDLDAIMRRRTAG